MIVRRLSYVIDNLRPGGTQSMLVALVGGLALRGYSQTVYCLNAPANGDLIARLSKAGAFVIVIGKWKTIFMVGLLQIMKDWRREPPDIVQTFLPVSDIIGRTLAKLCSVPVIVSSIRARNVDKRFWQFWLDRFTAPWADKIIFNSREVIPFAMKHEGVCEKQVVFIPNGVHLPEISSQNDIGNLKRSHHLEYFSPLIGTIGRLKPQKGHDYLIEAFGKFLDRYPRAGLLIVGEGPLRKHLEEKVSKLRLQRNVVFLGEQPFARQFLPLLDLFVLSSLWEGMPNVILEAMAARVPIVATHVDGTRELLKDKETALLVEPANVGQLHDACVRAISHPSEMMRMADGAFQCVRDRYSLEKMIDNFDRIYKNLLQA